MRCSESIEKSARDCFPSIAGEQFADRIQGFHCLSWGNVAFFEISERFDRRENPIPENHFGVCCAAMMDFHILLHWGCPYAPRFGDVAYHQRHFDESFTISENSASMVQVPKGISRFIR
jgi:hypothetical protein